MRATTVSRQPWELVIITMREALLLIIMMEPSELITMMVLVIIMMEPSELIIMMVMVIIMMMTMIMISTMKMMTIIVIMTINYFMSNT